MDWMDMLDLPGSREIIREKEKTTVVVAKIIDNQIIYDKEIDVNGIKN
jgi:hypothetical protein